MSVVFGVKLVATNRPSESEVSFVFMFQDMEFEGDFSYSAFLCTHLFSHMSTFVVLICALEIK